MASGTTVELVVVPAYNEADALGDDLRGIQRVPRRHGVAYERIVYPREISDLRTLCVTGRANPATSIRVLHRSPSRRSRTKGREL